MYITMARYSVKLPSFMCMPTKGDVTDVFRVIERKPADMGLVVNDAKTK